MTANYTTIYAEMEAKKLAINAQLDQMRAKVMERWGQETDTFGPDAKLWTAEQRAINNKWARLYDWL